MMMTEMAAVSANALLLLCCCFFTSTVSEEVYAAVGDTVVLHLKEKLSKTDSLNWKLNDTRLIYWKGGKVAIGNEKDIDTNASLKLMDLKKGTVGPYISEIYSNTGKLRRKDTFTLHVLDRVPNPEVKVSCQKSPATLKCNVAPAPGLTFQWLQGDTLLKESQHTFTLKKDQVTEGSSFKCNVSNRVSYKISKPAEANCHKSSSDGLLFGFDFWTMVGILSGGGGLVLLLIIITAVCCTRARRQRHNRLKEEEELRLGWTSSQQQEQEQQQQQHHHHHQHQHQPAGHTGPRQHRSKPSRDPERPRGPNNSCTHPRHPRPSPRVPEHGSRPGCEGDEEQPPPLPQPRKKGPKTPRARYEVHA